MARIGHIPEIIEVKNQLEQMKQDGLVSEWELPYENLLTRRSAAVFFLTASDSVQLSTVWDILGKYEHFHYRENTEQTLSQLDYRIDFNNEQ